jgi:threonine/homoserine/homoserine lactone efflux protein
MSLETWLLFSGAALVVILIPGPLSLLMISNSLNYGLRRSYPAFLGGVIASICLLSASALGLGALLLASEQLFSALKIVGALYLFYLAWQSWQQSRQPRWAPKCRRPHRCHAFAPCSAVPSCWARAIRKTFCSSPLSAAVPQREQPFLPQLLVMIATWTVLDLCASWLTGWVPMARRGICAVARDRAGLTGSVPGCSVARALRPC